MARLHYQRFGALQSQLKRKSWREKLAIMSKQLKRVEDCVKCKRNHGKNGVPYLVAGNNQVRFTVSYHIAHRTFHVRKQRIGHKVEVYPLGGVEAVSRFINAHLNPSPKSPSSLAAPTP